VRSRLGSEVAREFQPEFFLLRATWSRAFQIALDENGKPVLSPRSRASGQSSRILEFGAL
jgi:hypothetical protein